MKTLILSAASLALFFMFPFTWQAGSQSGIHHGNMQLGVPAALAEHNKDKDKSADKDKGKDKDREKDKGHSKPDHHDGPSSPAAFRSIHGS